MNKEILLPVIVFAIIAYLVYRKRNASAQTNATISPATPVTGGPMYPASMNTNPVTTVTTPTGGGNSGNTGTTPQTGGPMYPSSGGGTPELGGPMPPPPPPSPESASFT